MLAALATAAHAQTPTPQVKSLVVRIHSEWSTGHAPENGAGVVIARDSNSVWIATARHVVSYQQIDDAYRTANTVWVEFFNGAASSDSVRADRVIMPDSALISAARDRVTQFRARGNANRETEMALQIMLDRASLQRHDVAALRVPISPAVRQALAGIEFDRLGDSQKLKLGEGVFPMGCPRSRSACWEVPIPGDGLVSSQPEQIRFLSTFVARGSSGGALFNDQWEVVGIVTEQNIPLAIAVPMREVTSLLASAGVPVQLHEPQVPRAGYHLNIDATFLTAFRTSSVPDSLALDDWQPSGRITVSTRGRSPFTWRVSAIRLAPYNTKVTALLGGMGYTLRAGRLTVQPYGELGMGRVDARYDRGGYHIANGASQATYVPLWTLERRDGIGIGGGLGLEYVIMPHVSIAATAARWSFGLPPHAPAFPGLFAGGGLRWSR